MPKTSIGEQEQDVSGRPRLTTADGKDTGVNIEANSGYRTGVENTFNELAIAEDAMTMEITAKTEMIGNNITGAEPSRLTDETMTAPQDMYDRDEDDWSRTPLIGFIS